MTHDVTTLATGPLDARLREALAELARHPHILVALDFDGVLAPLEDDPDASRSLPESQRALAALSTSPGVALALVSGRPVADLVRLASPAPGTLLAGSHGGEAGVVDDDGALVGHPVALTPEQSDLLAAVTTALEHLATTAAGAWVEHKPAAAVLHTRTADPGQGEAALAEALSGPGSWPGVHAMRGSNVVEIPVISDDKGQALTKLRARVGAEAGVEAEDVAVLFAGDDVTDENAIATLAQEAPGRDVGIKVGEASSKALYRVADPQAIAAVLAELARLRA